MFFVLRLKGKKPRSKKVTFYLSGEHRAQRKSHHFLICAQWSSVKSCAVRMSNAILRMTWEVQGIRNMHDRHQTNSTPFRFKHVPKIVQLQLGNVKWHPPNFKLYQKYDKGLRLRLKSRWEGVLQNWATKQIIKLICS